MLGRLRVGDLLPVVMASPCPLYSEPPAELSEEDEDSGGESDSVDVDEDVESDNEAEGIEP